MRYLLTITFALLLVLSCKPNEPQSQEQDQADMSGQLDSLGLTEDFLDFYDKFHTDSAYQMEHIMFPLMGLPANADTISNLKNFRHKKEDWVLHHHFNDPFGDYEREYATPDDNIVVERFVIRKAGFYMERRFAKLDDEWFLIYYANVNRLPADQ